MMGQLVGGTARSIMAHGRRAASMNGLGAEASRLAQDGYGLAAWKRWGPYVSLRQWGTVREDYSADGDAWRSFSHDQARSRPTDGARTGSGPFVTAGNTSVSVWLFGTATTPF